jgi:hypothetical protein
MSEFIFVGYLIQEPYWSAWPKRQGYRVASIEREWHPRYNKHQWNQVQGIENPTPFMTQFPHLKALSLEPHRCQSRLHTQTPGWVVCGYAVPREVAEQPRMITIRGREVVLYDFRYALKMQRSADDLKLLGYEVVDQDDVFLSILNNCGYTTDQVRTMAGPLNEYSLLSSVKDAERFTEAIKTNPENPEIIPDHNQGIIVEIWGPR